MDSLINTAEATRAQSFAALNREYKQDLAEIKWAIHEASVKGLTNVYVTIPWHSKDVTEAVRAYLRYLGYGSETHASRPDDYVGLNIYWGYELK